MFQHIEHFHVNMATSEGGGGLHIVNCETPVTETHPTLADAERKLVATDAGSADTFSSLPADSQPF